MTRKSFGKYAVIVPVTYHFKQEEGWWWKILPPTSGNELEMQRFMVNGRVQVGADGVQREYPPTSTEVAFRELALTFGGTNIPVDDESPVEDGGEPVIKAGASTAEIEAVLSFMTHEMIKELWDAVGDAIPTWGPVRPKAKTSQS
jgi:hypothetical protein